MKKRSLVLILSATLACGVLIGRITLDIPVSAEASTAVTSPYARFVGSWGHHGGGLTVFRNGRGMHSYRLYVDCNTQHPTTCDKFINNTIYDGGFATFTLYRVVGNKAYGRVDNSSYSWQVGTTVTLVAKANDTLDIYEVGNGVRTACGPKAPAGYCGA